MTSPPAIITRPYKRTAPRYHYRSLTSINLRWLTHVHSAFCIHGVPQPIGNGATEAVVVEIPDEIVQAGWHDGHGEIRQGKNHELLS